ncbi:helicase-exonuclease AddAB subunit AddB [Salipaludibacillus daqingensis]|uniref:helicase-exonuclease AddAB subunit AddB n=1 Tax=Salipaludibacillus daqingensis TaxID=3041001 RepID=UPI002475165E|nr:helicase-exonuclease AddAB subunit AddB [Salipaludibacillus daqingensis]
MTISFYLGRSGSGKTTKMQTEMIHRMKENPTGTPVIYLVPEQMTFQAEKNLVTSLGKGMTRTQVLSFSRLALRVLQEVGGLTRYHIEKSGIQMLLRKIIEREKRHFQLFQKATTSQGFVEQLEQMLTEFKRYDIDSDVLQTELTRLQNSADDSVTERTLQDKLHDIHRILSRVEQELADKYIASEDYLQLLAEKMSESSKLKDAIVYIDGFHSFTPIEMNVLRTLFTTVKDVHIALTLDQPLATDDILHPLDLFYETGNTYQQLNVLCEECKLSDVTTNVFQEQKRFRSQGLAYLEANQNRRPAIPTNDHEGIRMISAVHRRGEVEKVAREVISLVRDEGYRYGEIAILLRNVGQYSDYFETVFHDEKIPFFTDQKRSALNHPLVEFIRSSMEVIQRHWGYEAVFRTLKTEILFPLNIKNIREKVDQLENYVLSYGIKGKRWYSDQPWTYKRMATTAEHDGEQTTRERTFEIEINDLRQQLMNPLIQFQTRVKRAKTVQEYCHSLFQLLEDVQAAEKLELLRNEAVELEDLREANEHDQLWNQIIHLMDQMVEISGEEEVSFDLFMKMIDTGLEGLTFSIIPPAFDQVVIADMEMSRLSHVRCAFIMGVNDGVIPAKPDESSLVSEEERTQLEKQGVQLAPGAERQLLNESFLIYMAQAIPQEKLYFTYPLADEEGRSLQPSMMLNYIQELFPKMEVEVAFDSPLEVSEQEEQTFITHPQKTLSQLTQQLQGWQRGYHVSSMWWDVYNWFINQPTWNRKVSHVLKSLHYKNEPSHLPTYLTEELYGTTLKTSVSRMEQYNACPFSQFANYGLKLKERETFKLEAPDIGTLFHAALKEMAEALRHDGKDFSHLTKDMATSMSKTIVGNLAPKIQREILLSSSRFTYIQQKLEEVVARASTVLAEQAKRTGFSPAGLEVGFGPEQQLPPLTFELDNGHKIELIGRIDRVDKAEDEEGVFVRILDYKSSSKDIKLDDVYEGLALQMLIYLDVVVSYASEWLGTEVTPAGVLYFHVHNPMIQSDQKLSLEEIEAKILKEFKMKGLLSSSLNAIKQMDLGLDIGRSDIVPVGLKKDGQAYNDSKVISHTDYEWLRSYLRNHVKKVGESIMQGNIDLTPYKKKQQTPCTFCSYKSFCQFDPSIESNDYRHLSGKSNDDILELIRDEKGETDESHTETE